MDKDLKNKIIRECAMIDEYVQTWAKFIRTITNQQLQTMSDVYTKLIFTRLDNLKSLLYTHDSLMMIAKDAEEITKKFKKALDDKQTKEGNK